jgi:hypothetical protein
MRTQLLSGAGKRVLIPCILCCLWVFAVPVGASAATAFGNASCFVQSITMNGTTTWQIKGTATVTGLVPGNNAVTVTVQFQKKANGAANWANMFSVTQTTNGVNGTATIDTGFITFTPAPAAGDQYRIAVSGTYMTGTPPMPVMLVAVGSTAITPVP